MLVVCGQCRKQFVCDGDWASGATCPACGVNIVFPSLTAESGRGALLAPEEDEPDEGFATQARQTVGRKVTVICGSCAKPLKVGARLAGKTRKCPSCGNKIKIPYPDDVEEFRASQGGLSAGEIQSLDVAGPEAAAIAGPARVDQPAGGERAPGVPEPASRAGDVAAAPWEAPNPPASVASQPPPPARPAAAKLVARTPGEIATGAGPVWTKGPRRAPALPQSRAPHEGARKSQARRRTLKWTAAACGGLVVVAIAGAVCLHLHRSRPPGGGEGNALPAARGPNTPRAVENLSALSRGGDVVPQRAPAAATIVSHTAEILQSRLDVCAGGGYVVAPPGRLYWMVSLRLTAGGGPLSLNVFGDSVRLTTPQGAFPSLGCTEFSSGRAAEGGDGNSSDAAGAGECVIARLPLSLKSGQSREATFLFDVPEAVSPGRLLLVGVGELDVPLPGAAAGPSAGTVAGHYVEEPPRSLQPLLKDPVMRAIESAQSNDLSLTETREGLWVALPSAAAAGVAQPAGPGLYTVMLKGATDSLACKLRLVDSGRRAVLYLSDEPFHQVIFKRGPS